MKQILFPAAIAMTVIFVTSCGTTRGVRSQTEVVRDAPPPRHTVWEQDASLPVSASQFYGALKASGIDKPGG